MTSTDHVDELLPAYALGMLELDEEARVAAHLSGCARCQAELHTFQAIPERLAYAVPVRVPPARLRQSILQSVQPQAVKPAPAVRASWRERLAASVHRAGPAWAIASLVLLAVLVVSNLALWHQVQQLSSNTSGGFTLLALNATSSAPGANGLMVISRDGRYGTLVVDGLPDLGQGRQYQLWLIQDGQRTSGGVFSVDGSGYGSLWVAAPQPLVSYQTFGITIEPQGGSPGPTGQKVLGGSF
jgi:anti-sigma-K factor RskA